ELQARLVGQKLEDTPRARRFEPRCKLQRASAVQTEIVVVTLAVSQLRIVLADARADRLWFAEIQRRAGAGVGRLGQGNCGLVGRQEMIGGNGQPMIKNTSVGSHALEIEEAVIG